MSRRWRRSPPEVPFDLEDGRVRIAGHDVSSAIRTPEMDLGSSTVAKLPKLRAVLVARQQQMGEGGRVVMEGRDIGSVVFPHADVKIFLDASPEERAKRRAADPAHTGSQSTSSRSRARSGHATRVTPRGRPRRSSRPPMRW